jgi:pimeloyl-ACP methyl ester carboxylesterase
MPTALVRGATINYQVVGDHGPWFVLTPGGRSSLEVIRPLGENIAGAGYRVLLHDRRNCGASDVAISGDEFEDAMFADDVAELLSQLDAAPAIALGLAAGNRLCLQLAKRHAPKVRALILCWPVGGQRAVEILAETYYGQDIDVARRLGMPGVCDTPHYRERIERNPRNRELLLAMNVEDFVATMQRWREAFLASAKYPTMLMTDEQLRAIRVPTCVIPGLTDDPIHGLETSEAVAQLIPDAKVRWLPDERRPDDADNGWLRAALDRRASSPELLEHALAFAATIGEQ